MDFSKEGLAELASYEGLILTPYLCAANVKTVGFGSTKSDIPDLNSWSWSRQISIAEAIVLYKQGLIKYVNAVNKVLTRDIEQHQFDALVSITYNIGVGGMAGSTFMKYVNSDKPNTTIVAAMKRWDKGGGRVLKGLVNRREKEGNLYLNGVYSGNGLVSVSPVGSNHRPIYSKSKTINLLDYL